MPAQIRESDWKQFKKVHAELLEQFSEKVLQELAEIARSTNGTAHERYLKASKLIEKRDREMADTFDDFRRSTAWLQLALMRRKKLLNEKQLAGFSEEMQQQLRALDSL